MRVTNLTSFVIDLITKYNEHDQLNWERGIPDYEIWVKLGGDHGGGSFKLAVQVCNLDNRNSKLNTIAFACCKAKDYYQNLKDICCHYISDINCLSQATWKDKKLKCSCMGTMRSFVICLAFQGKGNPFLLMVYSVSSGQTNPTQTQRRSTSQNTAFA